MIVDPHDPAWRDWNRAVVRMPIPEGGCPCQPCRERRALVAWAKGELDVQPPEKLVKWTIRHTLGERS